ncbi:hypothetical protein F2Q68_00003660 [Brassica cretica]|uniref:Uncharacterized protein n=1 Tax=Brassica cretica TaxID=69181 RepID=A0A8S9JMK3_BRACR|nr:hypothetical protein F2Q68_00003660 [Brassica cretica]
MSTFASGFTGDETLQPDRITKRDIQIGVDEFRRRRVLQRDRTTLQSCPARFDEATARSDEATARFDEATARSDEATARFDEATARSDEATARFDEATARSDEATARSNNDEELKRTSRQKLKKVPDNRW